MNAGDLSTESVCPGPRKAEVQLIAKASGVIAGLDVFERTFVLLDPATSFEALVADGDEVTAGQLLGTVRGDARVLLSGERVALNFLQRMSGIATYTHAMAKELEGTKTMLVDTRKTTPGLRIFEKAAVEAGGGHNHRYNLSQAVMLKGQPHRRCRWNYGGGGGGRAPTHRSCARSRSSARPWTWCARHWMPERTSSCSTT